MCGIAAIFSKNSKPQIESVSDALERMSHRGFFSEIREFDNCILGVRRLPIVDRENGQQPISNENDEIFVVFNGEIYNHQALKKELLIKGHVFKTDCDTEVLVHLWEEFGKEMVGLLDGIFAFVIYDKINHQFFAARDHIGVKPLYYYHDESTIVFASEMKGFVSDKRAEISELLPSNYYYNGKQYRYITYSTEKYNSNLTKLDLINILTESVKKRVNTDLPVAVFFSGGIDSAIILELARKFKKDVTAITVGLNGSEDLKMAIDYCYARKIKHIVRIIQPWEIKANLNKILFYLESFEPNLVRGAIFSYFMAQVAKESGFVVALSGEGSDEIFYGYKDFTIINPSQSDNLSRLLTNDLYRTQLLRLDRCTMAHTIETRVPYLDHRVIEFARGLPISAKLNGQPYETKKILREAFYSLVGREISERPKNPMDEGAVPGGKKVLDVFIKDYLSSVSIPMSYLRDYKINIECSFEESFYLKHFLENGYNNSLSTNRIFVRKH